MTTQPESKLSKTIIDAINALPRATAHKVAVGPYHRAGEPDIDAVIDGRAVQLEVKRPGTEAAVRRATTALQRSRLRDYEEAGAIVGVVTSVEEALHLANLIAPIDLEQCTTCSMIRARWAE